MGIDALLREVRERSREEEAEIRREAEEQSARVVEEARRKAEQRRHQALQEAEDELREELRAERERAENDVRQQVMEARAELLGRVRETARGLLDEAAASGAYRRELPARIRDARACLPEDREIVIRCSPSLEGAIRDALSGTHGRVRVETDDGGAGFRASTPGGTITADASLARRLERDWTDLAPMVLEKLEERWAETGDR